MMVMRTQTILLLAILAFLSACGTVAVKPEDCPSGTQQLAGCPPLGAVDDPDIGKLYESREWQKVASLDINPVEFGREAKIPINHARAKFIGSTVEGGLTSLAAYLWLMTGAILLAFKEYRKASRQSGGRVDLYLGIFLALVAFNVAGIFEANWRDTELQRMALFLLASPYLVRRFGEVESTAAVTE